MSSSHSPIRTCEGSNVPLDSGGRTELSALIRPVLVPSLRTSTSSPGSLSRSTPEVVCKSEDSVEVAAIVVLIEAGESSTATGYMVDYFIRVTPFVDRPDQHISNCTRFRIGEASRRMDSPPPSFPEYDGRHPLISLLSACFWVFSAWLLSRRAS